MQPRVFEKLFHGIASNEKGKVVFKPWPPVPHICHERCLLKV